MMIYVLLVFLIHACKGHPSLFHCDFETPCIDFEIDDNWNVSRSNHSQLINHDHTSNNQSGSYLWFKSKGTIKTSDWVQPLYDQAVCFNLWYYASQGQLSFEIQLFPDENLISGKDSSIDDWRLIHIRLPPEKVQILIRLNTTSGFLAVDDLSIDLCPEVRSSSSKLLFSCDGESSCIEDIISLSDYPYQWSLIQANDTIAQENPAPAIDSTFHNESGHYFSLANSQLIQKGNVGYLAINKSFHITNETSYCLNFYYYAYGEEQKSHLKIYARMFERPDIVRELWPIQSSKRYQYVYNEWTWEMVNLPRGDYSLLFRMDSQEMGVSSFALDDMNITSCDYPPSEFISLPSFLSFSCHFDGSSICDIQNEVWMILTSFNFTLVTGDTVPNRELGPIYDYTTNSSSGGFIYWNRRSNFSETDFGMFGPSKSIERNTNMCIKFAYYVKSSKNKKRETLLLLRAVGCAHETLWSQMLNDSHGWQLVIIPLQDYACAETFYFGVSPEEQSEVSIAFDEIRFEQCNLINTTNILLTTTTCPSSTILQNNSHKTFPFNEVQLIIFLCFFIIIGGF